MYIVDQTITSTRAWIKYNILKPAGLWRAAGANLDIDEDDIFVVSYPRSGNTWMRFLLASLRYGKELRFNNINVYVPDIYQCSQREINRAHKPRLIKSHEAFNPDYPRAICIVRDPRDVAISLYYYQRRNRQQVGELMTFLKDRFPFESWAINASSWLDACDRDATRYQLIRYEDLKANTLDSLDRVARFLNLQVDTEQLKYTIHACKADRMRRGERRYLASILSPLLRFGNGPQDSFVRKAAAEQWRAVFDAELIELYEDHFGDLMDRLGYPRGST